MRTHGEVGEGGSPPQRPRVVLNRHSADHSRQAAIPAAVLIYLALGGLALAVAKVIRDSNEVVRSLLDFVVLIVVLVLVSQFSPIGRRIIAGISQWIAGKVARRSAGEKKDLRQAGRTDLE